MRLRPYSRASIDHAPGPSSTRLAAIDATIIGVDALVSPVTASATRSIARHDAASGVHSPARTSTAARQATRRIQAMASKGHPPSCVAVLIHSAAPQVKRNSSRPHPGRPFGKVENSRCMNTGEPIPLHCGATPSNQ